MQPIGLDLFCLCCVRLVRGGLPPTVGVLPTTITLLTHTVGPPFSLHLILETHTAAVLVGRLGFQVRVLVAWIFSILSISSPCSLFGLISWTLPAACYAWACPPGLVGLPQNTKVVLLSFWGVGSPSLVLAVGHEPSHGRLDPRSRGDVERANRRKSLPLDNGDLSWKRLARRERSC